MSSLTGAAGHNTLQMQASDVSTVDDIRVLESLTRVLFHYLSHIYIEERRQAYDPS
jgi:hypothetical protein